MPEIEKLDEKIDVHSTTITECLSAGAYAIE